MRVRHWDRDFSEEELAQIRQRIGDSPDRIRAKWSRLTCRSLSWYKSDGGLKEISSRVAACCACWRMDSCGCYLPEDSDPISRCISPPDRSCQSDPYAYQKARFSGAQARTTKGRLTTVE